MIFFNPYRFAASGGSIAPETGMLAYYRGDNDYNDYSGNANHAAPGAGSGFAVGQVNQAFLFNGNQNSRILTPTINVGAAYSVEFYAYVTAAVGGDMVFVVNDYTASTRFGGIYLDGTSKCLQSWFGNTERLTASRAIPLNIWIKVLFTYDGNKHRIYLNDLLDGEETGTHTTEVFNNAVGFGWSASSNASDQVLQGKMDEIKIYNYAKAPSYSGLIAQYDGENNALDSANSIGFNGTAGVATAYGAGRLSGNSFLFNGASNSAVQIPKVPPMKSPYSIEAWIYSTNSAGFAHIISGNWNGTANGALYRNVNKLEYWQGGSKKVETAASSIPINTWTKVKMTYDGSKTRLYIDGSLSATESGTHVENKYAECAIGYAFSGSDAAFTGRIDEVKFYNAVV